MILKCADGEGFRLSLGKVWEPKEENTMGSSIRIAQVPRAASNVRHRQYFTDDKLSAPILQDNVNLHKSVEARN